MPTKRTAKPPKGFDDFHRKLRAARTHDEIIDAQHGPDRIIEGSPDFPDVPYLTALEFALTGGFAI